LIAATELSFLRRLHLIHSNLPDDLASGLGEEPVRGPSEPASVPPGDQALRLQNRHHAWIGPATQSLWVRCTGSESVEAALGDGWGDGRHGSRLPRAGRGVKADAPASLLGVRFGAQGIPRRPKLGWPEPRMD